MVRDDAPHPTMQLKNQPTGVKRNACNPDAGADFVQQQVARNSKEQVAEKEDPGEQTELLAGDRQFLVHRQRRKTNVNPVEKANDVQQEYVDMTCRGSGWVPPQCGQQTEIFFSSSAIRFYSRLIRALRSVACATDRRMRE